MFAGLRSLHWPALLLLLSCGLPLPLMAEELRVVLFDVPPYASEQGGRAEGIYVDLVQRLASRMGLAPRFEIVPFARVAHLLEKDKADLTISFGTEALEKVAVALQPVRKVKSVVLLAKGRNAEGIEKLAGLEIGRLRGGCRDLFGQQGPSIRAYEVNSLGIGVRMLAAGRLDGLCATQDAIDYALLAETMPLTRLGNYLVTSEREAWVHVRKRMPQAMQESIRQAARELFQP